MQTHLHERALMNKEELENKENIENKESKDEAKTTYTLDEVQALLQKEGDRRVSQALKKAEQKNKEAIKEAEKLAKMNESERYEHELKQREEAIAEKERKIALMENEAEASKALASRGISIELTSLVVAEDADDMMDNIKLLEDEFKKSVKAEVEKRLAGNAPKKNLDDSEMTKEKFTSLSMGKQMELLEANPQYEKFLGV